MHGGGLTEEILYRNIIIIICILNTITINNNQITSK